MNKLYVSMYHYTRDLENSRYPNIKGLDVKLFEQQLVYFKENFNVVRMEDVIDAVYHDTKLPENAILLTFDDGYIDNFTFAMPLLEKYSMQGSFFIPTKTFSTHTLLDVNKIHYILASAKIECIVESLKKRMDHYRGGVFCFDETKALYEKYAQNGRFDSKDVVFTKLMLQVVLPEKLRNIISSELFKEFVGIDEKTLAYELYMNPEQLYTMKRHGMFIGLHGHDHYYLTSLSENEIETDIKSALDILGDFIDTKSWVMCYPYGDFNDKIIKYIKQYGAVLGFTTDVNVTNINKENALKISRLDCNHFPPKSEYFKNF